MSQRSNTFSFQNNHKDSRNMQNTGPWVSNNRWTQSSDQLQAFDHSHFDIGLHNASPQNRTNSIAMKTATNITNSSTSALPVPTYSQGLSKPVKSETGMADNFNRNQNKHFTESIEKRCPQPIITEHWNQEHNTLPPQTFVMGPSGSASGSQFSSFGNIPQQSGSTSSQNHIKQTNSKETMWIPSHGQAQPQQKMFSGPPPCLPPLTRLPPPQFPPVFNPLAPPPPLPGFPPPSLPQPFGGQPPPPFPRPMDNSSFNYIPISGAPFNANSAYAPVTAPYWTEKINGQKLLQQDMTGNTGTNMTNKETSQQNTNTSEPGAQAELNHWLKKIKKFGDHMVNGCTDSGRNHQLEKLKNIKESDRINFPDAQNKLCSLLHALAAVQGALQQLQEDHEMASSDAWHQSVTQIQELKEKYLATKQLLNYEQLKTLQKKLEARRRKRAQIKLQKLREKDKKQEMLFEQAKKHAALDLWQDQILQKDLRQKQIKEMKETADRTLAKVRREIREATKMLDTMKSLQKLRDIRKDTAEKRGQTFPPSIAEHFSSKMTDLTQLLSEQIQAFEKEEATLKIILETEQEEARVKKEQEKQQKEKQQKQDDAQSLSLSLFGPEVVRSYGDLMLPFDQFYQQARCSLQAFISVRHIWDMFLVPEGTQGGSRIPDGWVEPELPTSSVWASVIQANSTTN